MKTSNLILTLAAALMLSACNDNALGGFGSAKNRDKELEKYQVKMIESNESLEKVLGEKYEKAELRCELWVNGSEFRQDEPADVAVFDLKSALGKQNKTLELKAGQGGSSVQIRLQIRDIKLMSYLYVEGPRYVMKARNSPVIELVAVTERRMKSSTNSMIQDSSNVQRLAVYEKMARVIENSSAEGEERAASRTQSHAQCTIMTVIKDEFASQFMMSGQ